jgi:osmotically-inducible protein OsmY
MGIEGVRRIENDIGILYPDLRTDDEIRADIKRRYQWDIWLDADAINVTVREGQVTLEGLVSSAKEKQKAFEQAWVVGVTEVDTIGLDVEWWTRREWDPKKSIKSPDDQEIRNAIRDALKYDPRVETENVRITVVDGEVTLAGKVDNLRAKKAAGEDSRNAMGVWRVKNYIKVRPTKITGDAVMEELIEDEWNVDPVVDANDLDVSVFDGQAVISGVADHYLEKVEAEDLAAGVYGVVHVVNNIILEQAWEDKEDWILKEDVEYQLFWNPRINSDSVEVLVDDGIVTLVGKVNTLYQRRQATVEAKQAGAEHVNNLLVFSLGPPAIKPETEKHPM